MADKKHKKVLGSLQPDIEDILSWNDLPDNAFEPASVQEKAGFIQDRKSVSYWADAWRRLRKNKVAMVALVIIVLLASLINNVSDLAWVQNAFAGIRVCVCVQLFNAVIKLAKKSIVDKWTVLIFTAVFLLGAVLDLSPVWFVLAAAAAGLLVQQLGLRKEAAR